MKWFFVVWKSCSIFCIFLFAFFLFSGKAHAATFNCTTTTSGTWNWNTGANWANCNGSYPGAAGGNVYNVAINSTVAAVVNLNIDVANIGTITIIGNGVAHTLNFNGHTLTSSSTTAINAPTAIVTNSISVDTGTFNAGGTITITSGSASTRVSQVTATTGTINVTGAIAYAGTAAGAKVSVTSTGTVIATSIGAGGLFSEAAATGSLQLTGASPAIQMGGNYTYNNIEFAGSGTATFSTGATINGTLTVTSGALDFGANAVIVTGATEVKNAATLTFSSATNTKTFGGLVTLDSGSTWDNSINSAVTYRGGLTNNGATTLTIGTGTQTFSTNNQNIGGSSSITIPNMVVTSIIVTDTYTSSSPKLTISTLLSGTGTLRQSANGYLLVASATITTLDNTTNTPNTVEYNGSGTPTIKGTTYDYLIFSGSGNGTLSTTTTVNHDFTVSDGTVTTGANTITVTGTTTVSSATLAISSTTGTKTFGDITLDTAAIMSFTAAEGITMNGSLQINDTSAISGTTGAWAFQDASGGTIGGTTNTTQTIASATFTTAYGVSIPLTITGALTVTGVTLTNNDTLIVGGNLTGVSGSLVQGTGASVSLAGTSTITTLDASATDNTVSYTGSGTQTIKAPSSSYYNLTYSGSSTGTLAADTVIKGDLSISSGTMASGSHIITLSGDFNHSGGAFTQGTGTVTFVDPTQTTHIIGTTTFYKFISTIPNKAFIFTHGVTTTVSNTLTLNGQSCESPISISSDSSGSSFTLTAPAGSSAPFLSVKDSSSTNALTASNSISVSGNGGSWSITPGVCAGQTTAYSFQRKTFYDSTNSVYWRFSYDGTQIKGEYNTSPWNSGWTASSSIAANTNGFSLWKDSTYAFIAYVSNNSIVVRRGTMGATSITWGSPTTVFNGTSLSDTYVYPHISEDSAGFLWVSATYNNSINSLSYSLVTNKSTSSQNPASWGAANTMANTNTTNADLYGATVPLGSQNMLTVYEVNGTLYSQLYSNGSGYGSAVTITASANTSIDKNFSITTDSSNNVHLVVIDTSGLVQYYKYTGTWSSATRLDTSATNQYPSIAIDTATNDVYVIYYRSSKIYYKQYHGGWGSETNTTWTTSATSMNLGLNYSDSGYVYGVWQTGSGPYTTNWNNVLLPSGFLSLSAPSSASLSDITIASSPQTSTGGLGLTTVTDYRGTGPGWSLTITVSNFTISGHTIPVTNFTVNPSNSTLAAVVGSLTGLSSGVQHTFSGTNDPANIVSASSGSGQGQYTINPDLSLSVPVGSYWGAYTATVTETVQ